MLANIRSLALTICLCVTSTAVAEGAAANCDRRAAQWLDPASGMTLATENLFARLPKHRIVLLGEEHTAVEHHRWQTYVLSALHSRKANLTVGFEMLPRRVQPVLDEWSDGALTAEDLLVRSDWHEVWGYDAELYLPLLHFARLHRLPTVALNVDRELVSRVGREGWQAVTEAQREGLSDPAPASTAYRQSLARLFAFKQSMHPGQEITQIAEPEPEVLDKIKRSAAFANFVDAQLTWDRAMAEALAAAARRDPDTLVVGIVGRGHLEHGYGIPHQLADLDIEDVAVLLPMSVTDACDGVAPDLATAVFLLDAGSDERAATARPRLGVVIEAADGGVVVLQVVADSVAAQSGVLTGDVIESAAGFKTATPAALIEVVARQAPGTWLPLRVMRGDETRELVARFPQQFGVIP